MRHCRRLLLLNLVASLGLAQLTMDQKISDFQALAGLFAKRYAPYDWKVKAQDYDLLNIGPWLTQVQGTTNDLDYYEIMVNYVAGLNDAHAYYTLPANFQANLNFSVDIYDGKLLVDSINRTRLPASEFPFTFGYQLISIDGQDAQGLLDGLLQYNVYANPRSTRRLAAPLLTFHPQSLMPHAASVPEISTVVFQRPDGGQETYRIPWTKTGLPMTSVGQYTTPFPAPAQSGVVADPARPDDPPAYLAALNRLQNYQLPDKASIGYGALAPIFSASMPAGFVQRLGKTFSDPFYSGVFTANGYKIGFIRIPSFSPPNTTTATSAFQAEIAYFQGNTDGLVVDVMRNSGGSVPYMNTILSNLIPSPWTSVGFQIRASEEWVVAISSALVSAQALGAPKSILDLYQMIKDAILAADQQVFGLSDPVPLDNLTIDRGPAMDSKGNLIAYTKPIMVLVDELTASAGDAFAASIQDNTRGPLFGWRTMGAGGVNGFWEAGSYSLGTASVTESLMHRKNVIVTPDYPPAPYVENIGVRPEIQVDYMTSDNLTQHGKPFVDAFVAAMVAQLQQGN